MGPTASQQPQATVVPLVVPHGFAEVKRDGPVRVVCDGLENRCTGNPRTEVRIPPPPSLLGKRKLSRLAGVAFPPG
jgi:hypothetical protein